MYFAFGADALSWFFFGLVTVIWFIVGVFAKKYAEHMKKSRRFFSFYLLTYIMLAALSFAQSYITMYLCFEFMSLLSVPLVLHDERPESIAAAKKYLFYSIFGATLGLIGLFFATNYASLSFVPGGSLDMARASGHEQSLLVAIFLSVIGFGAKAGIYPLHSWLPAAHPEAPGPASAVLSGVITKAGVLCIIRVIYFVFGADFIRGTWVQYSLMCIAMLTIFLGSLMAYQQDHFKRRLAYSSVSQLSYILLGIFALNTSAFTGALLHITYHAVIKNCLFLVAAAIIFANDRHYVSELEGLGRKMPVSFACFTIASLGLVGVPPFAGFLSKWYLATGILSLDIPIISWLAPAVLLVSALLTAAYLFSIAVHAFFPRKERRQLLDKSELPCKEAPCQMTVPITILALLVCVLGIFAQIWIEMFSAMASGVL